VSAITDLSHTLWRQRRLLERLVYRLEVQQLLLAAGRTRWISTATADVEQVMDRLREEDLARAVQVSAVGMELGLGQEPSLRDLVEHAPAPWNDILREHQAAFLEMTSEVEELTRHNRELLARGYSSTRDLLAAMTDGQEVGGYSAAGSSTSFRLPASTIDRTV